MLILPKTYLKYFKVHIANKDLIKIIFELNYLILNMSWIVYEHGSHNSIHINLNTLAEAINYMGN